MREIPRIPFALFKMRTLLCCGLLLVFDGVIAQESPDKPDRWAEAMARFEAIDAKTPPKPGGTVFVGSSSIRMWDLKKSFPDWRAVNRGFGGSHIADSVRHLELLVLRHRPRRVVLYAGGNDIAAGKSPETVRDDFLAFEKGIHAKLPETEIYCVALKPTIARFSKAGLMKTTNRMIEAACKEREHCTFVDIWVAMLGDDGKPRKELLRSDGLHLTPAGYALWTRAIREAVQSVQADSARKAAD